MTITIEVLRGTGDQSGAEVSDALLGSSIDAALARGRAELDARAHARARVQLTIDYDPAILLGMRIAVTDPEMGETWQGSIIGLAHVWVGVAAETRLTVDRCSA
ncbi:hypothetical protein [uncultured Thiodictyon sp.]|uniref:hypothetical protein n=1 Tax=uncultured Thiodictyon sp. TaxID=1846217 RepID=UPI0025DC293A|nr:hypothetical protein [uncultured Thiodictyon sp.]